MADEIQGLVIEIEANAEGAASQLDILAQHLETLKTATAQSTSVGTYAKNFRKLAVAVNSIPNPEGVARLAESIASLSNLNGVKISTSIPNQLAAIGEASKGLEGADFTKLQELVSALSGLSALNGEVKISATIATQLQRVAEVSQQIQGYDFTKLQELITVLQPMSNLAEVSGDSLNKLSTSLKTVASTAKPATERSRTFNTVLANVRVRTMAFYRGLMSIARAMTKSLTVYGDYVEALNLYKMALGDAADEEFAFAEQAQNLLGIDLTQWMQAQGVFNALAKGFGVASDKAALMSRNLTQLAYDISSFYNIDVEDAIQKVQSGFAGQIRPVRNLGYDLSQARLEAIALANGIEEEVSAMTQAEKSQLRYIALMTQLTEVQGDLSRTLDSPTNQLRLLQAQLQQMYRSIGLLLLPLLNKVIPYLNAIFRLIKMIAEEIAELFGVTLPKLTSADLVSSMSVGADDLADDLDEANGAAEKLKNTLASFDQINLITSSSGGSGSGSGSSIGGSDLGLDLPSYDFLGDTLENKAQKIADDIMKSIRPVVEFLKDTIRFVRDNIDTIVDIVTTFAVVTIGKDIIEKLLGFFVTSKKGMETLSKFLKGIELVTIGFQFSYLGGKEMANGNFIKGFIESTLGAAASAYGGYLIFGPTGALIGLSVSLALTLTGLFSAKEDEELKKKAHDLFWSFREDAVSVDILTESWGRFVDKFKNDSLLEKNETSFKLQEEVRSIGSSIAELQAQYAVGNMTTLTYAINLESMYAQMEESVKNHLGELNNALNESLSGPLGLWLEAHGQSLEALKNSFKNTTDSIIQEIEKNGLALQTLTHDYEAGKISQEEYLKKSEELLAPLKEMYHVTGMNIESTENFLNTFKNIKINFDDLDQLEETLKQISDGYDETMRTIEQLEASDIGRIESAIPFASPEDRVILERALEEMKNYYKVQKETLNDGYTDLISSIENQKAIQWSEVFNQYGLGASINYIGEDLSRLDELFNTAYGKQGVTRNNTYWTELSSLMNKTKNNLDRFFDDPQKWNDAALGAFGGLSRKITSEVGGVYDNMEKKEREFNKRQKSILNGLVTTYVDSKNNIRLNLEEMSRAGKLYADNTKLSMFAVNKAVGESTEYLDIETDQVSKKYMDLSYLFGDEELLADPLYTTMMHTADVMGSSSVLNAFTHGADVVMGKVSSEITGSKNAVQKAYFGALEVPTQKVVDIGGGLGLAIAKGMKDTTPEIQKSTQYAMGAAAKEVNKFGDGLGDFFRDIAKAFNDSFASGLTNIFGQTSTYTPPKIKTPKVKGYATGGFPDTADFFYANENGVPEYVGSLGGRTAVATNTDIVKGVSDGVYRAITSTGIQNDVKRIASKNGTVVFAPSEEAGKVMSQSVNMYNGTGGRY